jgi:hypothetical protein
MMFRPSAPSIQGNEQEIEMPLVVTKQQATPNIDAGTYTLELTAIREVQVSDFDNPGEKTNRIELSFVIRDHPRWQGATFTDLATPRLGSRAKLGQIMTALNDGVDVPDGDVDLETFIGRRMQATIRRKDNGYNVVIAETAVPSGIVEKTH